MQSPTVRLRLFWAILLLLGFSVLPTGAQQQPQPGAPSSDVSNIPKPIIDTLDRINTRNGPKNVPAREEITEKDDICLLPPLTSIKSPTIKVEQLRIAAKARKEYHQACVALKKDKVADAEKHFRKAVEHDPKYGAA